MALLALSEWKDKYLFKEQMPSAQGPWRPQLQSEWEPAPLRAGAAAAPGGVRRGCAEEWTLRVVEAPCRQRGCVALPQTCWGTEWVTGSPVALLLAHLPLAGREISRGVCVPRTVPGASQRLASL